MAQSPSSPPPPSQSKQYAIELYFDPALENQVLKAWNVLARRQISNRLISISSRPHITLLSSPSLDPSRLLPSIRSLAARSSPLPLTLSSVAAAPDADLLFLGPTPTAAMIGFHAQLCEVLKREGVEIGEAYRVDSWVPHCAVAEDVPRSRMAEAFCIMRDLKLPVSGYAMDIGLHGVSIHNGRVCIVMKFYEGSVGDKMAHLKGGKLSLSDALRYGADLAQGILELHSRGILVLNLKPCNFLLDGNDQAILGDFGIPTLLFGLLLPNSDLVQRLGTPNYMAPEQWQPDIRGPFSFETDAWGFGCSILEMLSGYQPWRGKSPDEIYHLVVTKQEKPPIPSGLPPSVENVLCGCFQYDFRSRPLMGDIIEVFKSCRDAISRDDDNWSDSANKSTHVSITDWSLLKDHLQVGDIVRSRKPKDCCWPESMTIPEGTVVGMETEGDPNSFVLVRVHGLHNPLRVHSSAVERVTFGFAAGDWVQAKDADTKHRSPVGILHGIDRDGNATAGFIGMENLWHGNYSELQMAEAYCVGQFLRIKAKVSSPRFEWPRNRGGGWATGRISQILPNGCLVVKFPGMFSFGESLGFLADPVEVEAVSFSNCEGVVKKYQHLEDFHWAVRPLVIALGLFTALKLGVLVGKSVGVSSRKKSGNVSGKGEAAQQQDGQNESNPQWLPPSVANILFREGGAPSAR